MNRGRGAPQRLLDALSGPARSRVAQCRMEPVVASTNQSSWELLEQGAADATVLIAESQMAGRGRLGRSWSSPPGNLYLSLLRRIREPVERSSVFSLLAGIAMCEAVAELTPVRARLKWPNDLLVGGRKLAGILLEGRDGWQVVGIGVNLAAPLGALPPEVRELATSVEVLAGTAPPPELLAAAFLNGFFALEEAFLADPRLPVTRYLAHCDMVGTRVRVQAEGELEGTVVGVAQDGALLLADAAGIEFRVTTGEVHHVRKG